MITYKKVGGIRFWSVGRFGGSFYVSKRTEPRASINFDFTGLALCAMLASSAYFGL